MAPPPKSKANEDLVALGKLLVQVRSSNGPRIIPHGTPPDASIGEELCPLPEANSRDMNETIEEQQLLLRNILFPSKESNE